MFGHFLSFKIPRKTKSFNFCVQRPGIFKGKAMRNARSVPKEWRRKPERVAARSEGRPMTRTVYRNDFKRRARK